MRAARIYINGVPAGILVEYEKGTRYVFSYLPGYAGDPVSLTMPLGGREYVFEGFPPFFDGLLPEGIQLEGLIRERKIDRNDSFSQLLAVGGDMPGVVTAEEMTAEEITDVLSDYL